MTTNPFTIRNNNYNEKIMLRNKLHAIRVEEEAAYNEYLRSLERLITAYPNLTAGQLAAKMSNDPEEQNSIATSIGLLGYNAQAAHNHLKRSYTTPEVICERPAMPRLRVRFREVIRRYVELDENGNQIGAIKTATSFENVYYIQE